MKLRQINSPAVAAAKASFSTASAYRIEDGERVPPQDRPPRTRRRPDPLGDLFEDEMVPMLEAAPKLRSVAIVEEMFRRYPKLSRSLRRTMERRIRKWRAVHGPEQDVIFRQTSVAGRLGLSDFTDMRSLDVMIAGEPLEHRLFHFRLAFSGWAHAHVVLGGESFSALAEGLQNALWSLGAVPIEHRTDSLSAAFCNLDRAAREDLTQRYDALCQHYGMTPTRNNRGVAHENGAIEGPHGHLKAAIRDALLLRGSSDFATLAEYRGFIDERVAERNRRIAPSVEIERPMLQPLPSLRTDDFQRVSVKVTAAGGFTLRKVFYTVPSRLIHHTLRAHLFDDRVELFLGETALMTLHRARPEQGGHHGHVVDYRHVIHALKRKPMALLHLVYRDQLFPRPAYRAVFDHLLSIHSEAQACRITVKLLALAHEQGCEAALAAQLEADLNAATPIELDRLRTQFAPDPECLPTVIVECAALSEYDELLDLSAVEAA